MSPIRGEHWPIDLHSRVTLPPPIRRISTTLQQRNPTDVAAIRMLAEVAGRIGRYEDAESLLRRALELCPSFAAARFNLAIVLHRQHRSAEAVAEIEILLEDDPDSPAYRNLHGAV